MSDLNLRGYWIPDERTPGWGWIGYRYSSAGPYLWSEYVPVCIPPDEGGESVPVVPEPELEYA